MLPVLSREWRTALGRARGSLSQGGNRFHFSERVLYECGMKVDGKPTRTIWLEADGWSVGIIDQTVLPHRFATLRLTTLDDAARAIKTMQVRGAPLIGAAAAYGVCLALRADASDEASTAPIAALLATRPTAINLKWALDEMRRRRAQPAARGAGRGGLSPRRRDRRRGCRHQPGDRPAWPEADRGRSRRARTASRSTF